MKEENPFGVIVAHVSVIEFQKRGLPHAHIILFLDDRAKHNIQNPEYVDEIISAEIPPLSDPVLRLAVLKHMIHKPCTKISTAPCIRDVRCSEGFRKNFVQTRELLKAPTIFRTRDVLMNKEVRM